MRSAEITFCDRCNASIPETALQDGSAIVKDGRGYCKECRDFIAAPSFSEEVHFCDGCNVSISVGEIREGRAFFHEGRLVCNQCLRSDPAAAGLSQTGLSPDSIPSASIPSASGPGAVLSHSSTTERPTYTRLETNRVSVVRVLGAVALLAVAVVVVVGAVFFPDRFALGGRSGATPEESATGKAASGESSGDVAGSDLATGAVTDLDAESAAPPALAETEPTELEVLNAMLATIESRLERLEERELAAAEADGRFDRIESSLRNLEQGSKDTFTSLGTELGEIREMVASLARSAEAAELDRDSIPVPETDSSGSDVGVTATSEPVAEEKSEADGLLEGLKSPEAGRRFSALVELGRRGDKTHIPAIAEVLLRDEDFVVREFAANVLGNFGERSAVEFLIRSLHDPAPSVVIASDEALSRITKKRFGMKRRSSASTRAEVVRKWESWWEKNADDFR